MAVLARRLNARCSSPLRLPPHARRWGLFHPRIITIGEFPPRIIAPRASFKLRNSLHQSCYIATIPLGTWTANQMHQCKPQPSNPFPRTSSAGRDGGSECFSFSRLSNGALGAALRSCPTCCRSRRKNPEAPRWPRPATGSADSSSLSGAVRVFATALFLSSADDARRRPTAGAGWSGPCPEPAPLRNGWSSRRRKTPIRRRSTTGRCAPARA